VRCVLSYKRDNRCQYDYQRECCFEVEDFDKFDNLTEIIDELKLSILGTYDHLIKDFTYFHKQITPEQKEQSKLLINFIKESCLLDSFTKDTFESCVSEGYIKDEQINRIKYFSLFKSKNIFDNTHEHIGRNFEAILEFITNDEDEDKLYDDDNDGVKLLFYILISLSNDEFENLVSCISFESISSPFNSIGYTIAYKALNTKNYQEQTREEILDKYNKIYGSALSGVQDEPKILTKEIILNFMNERNIDDSDFFSQAFITKEFIEHFLNFFERDIKITKFSILYYLEKFLGENY
jgi:hypothetical protein